MSVDGGGDDLGDATRGTETDSDPEAGLNPTCTGPAHALSRRSAKVASAATDEVSGREGRRRTHVATSSASTRGNNVQRGASAAALTAAQSHSATSPIRGRKWLQQPRGNRALCRRCVQLSQ